MNESETLKPAANPPPNEPPVVEKPDKTQKKAPKDNGQDSGEAPTTDNTGFIWS